MRLCVPKVAVVVISFVTIRFGLPYAADGAKTLGGRDTGGGSQEDATGAAWVENIIGSSGKSGGGDEQVNPEDIALLNKMIVTNMEKLIINPDSLVGVGYDQDNLVDGYDDDMDHKVVDLIVSKEGEGNRKNRRTVKKKPSDEFVATRKYDEMEETHGIVEEKETRRGQTAIVQLDIIGKNGRIASSGDHQHVAIRNVQDDGSIINPVQLESENQFDHRVLEEPTCDCNYLSHLCVKNTKSGKAPSCRKGKEFSKKCKTDDICYSGNCDQNKLRCSCPSPVNCHGCNNIHAPCIRLEQWTVPINLCKIMAFASYSRSSKSTGKTSKTERIKVFDVGVGNTITYSNMRKIVEGPLSRLPKSANGCFFIRPFDAVKEDSASESDKLPPAFVQASVLNERIEEIGQILIKGDRESFLGMQVFLNQDWITHIDLGDLMEDQSSLEYNGDISSSGDSALEFMDLVTIVKEVYPRVNLDLAHLSPMNLKTSNQHIHKYLGKTVVVHVKDHLILDFDFGMEGMAIEFFGQNSETSQISIIGDISMQGRANFRNVQVSFKDGSLNIGGSLAFQSSQISDIERCPLSFIEFNNNCFYVSDGIEQADDAKDFCGVFHNSYLSRVDDSILFLEKNRHVLGHNAIAWVQSANEDECTYINSDGVVYTSPIDTDTGNEIGCNSFIHVICSTTMKMPIHGKRYTSYNSNQMIGTYSQDYFKRILDESRLPFSSNGTVSFLQHDVTDLETDEPVIFVTPDMKPAGISVRLTFYEGSGSGVKIALDTSPHVGSDSYTWPVDDYMVSLPTKIQLHAISKVCIKQVDLLVHNETNHEFFVATIPSEIFKDCLDYNVCSKSDELKCGRSLMYYDELNTCYWMEPGSPVIPQDVSFDLLDLQCGRLTTWCHQNLGSPIMVEALFTDIQEPINIEEILGENHNYTFYNDSTSALKLQDSKVLPVDFSVKGVAALQAIRLTRYDMILSQIDFSNMWDCINICPGIAKPSSLQLSPMNATGAIINLISPIECQKLISVSTKTGNGREKCTIILHEGVDSLEHLSNEINAILLNSNQYKTISVNITKRLIDKKVIAIPPNRGLILFHDFGENDQPRSIEGAKFVAKHHSELQLQDILFNGTSQIYANELSQVIIEGIDISTDETVQPFLTNAGFTSMTSVVLFDDTTILNLQTGKLEMMYVDFKDRSTFVNSLGGTMQVSRVMVHEEFLPFGQNIFDHPTPLDKGNGSMAGIIELLDSRRFYETVDDEDDQDCFGSDTPHKIINNISTEACQEACDNEFQCSGVLTFYNVTTALPQCGLCLKEESCSFNCSSVDGGAYFKAISKFDYSKIHTCPYQSRTFKMFHDVTLEDCKVYCSYFVSCEGFRILSEDTIGSIKSCELYADLDFGTICGDGELEYIYHPYIPESTAGYINVFGEPLPSSQPIAKHLGLNADECSHVCKKTISCSSFLTNNDGCELYQEKFFIGNNENKGLYISSDDTFPKKMFMTFESCFLPKSYASFNSKTVGRCKTICSADYSCIAFSFRPMISLTEDNCELYDSVFTINGLFGPEIGCQTQPLRQNSKWSMMHDYDMIISSDQYRFKIDFQHLSSFNAREMVQRDNKHFDDSISIKGSKNSKSIKGSKNSKSIKESSRPSEYPSVRPTSTPNSTPSDHPSYSPSLSSNPSNVPSMSPTASFNPSLRPTKLPSIAPSDLPSLSSSPSANPSLSIRPSHVSETYDIFVAFSTEIYTHSNGRRFSLSRNITGLVEDECKALCYYDATCIAIKYDASTMSCGIGKLSGEATLTNETSYLSLSAQSSDETSRYVVSNSCFVGQKLLDLLGERVKVEKTHGYFHLPRTCVPQLNMIDSSSSLLSPVECSKACDDVDGCVGFIYYTDYGGVMNTDDFGKCRNLNSFMFGTCDGVENNMDIYLRADLGTTCQTLCNVHQLCTAFVFDGENCDLYSDVAILDDCPSNEQPTRINVGLSYRWRDAMVAAPGQCPVKFEDTHEIGCYNFTDLMEEPNTLRIEVMTPLACQSYCRHLSKPYYAMYGGNSCSCGSKEYLSLQPSIDDTQKCDIPCGGDVTQSCGGVHFALIGETDLPLLNMTISQCKTECYYSESCEAIVFDDSEETTKCHLKPIGQFEECSSPTNSALYVESLEHYYAAPRMSYIGTQSLQLATTDLLQDCQILCDAFESCEAINYTDTKSLSNCELLGGEVVGLEMDGIAKGIQVANDINLFTQGVAPKSKEKLVTFDTAFDLDECRALCEYHVLCGSFDFLSPYCTLYNKNAFSDIDIDSKDESISMNSLRHYIDYKYFVDPGQEFALVDELCVAESGQAISSRLTSLSKYDCSILCNKESLCSTFTYNSNSNTCNLYDASVPLTRFRCSVQNHGELYIMYTRSKFTEKPDTCLMDEVNLKPIDFPRKNPYECAALCDKWFNCRSFRMNDMNGLCRLYQSEQFSTDACPAEGAPPGNLYVYYSDYRFTRLDRNFCVGSSPIVSVENLPIEACKSICDKLPECLSFEHTQVGLCVLYESSDFSSKCTSDDSRDLYITYKDVVDPESRYLFTELDSCFKAHGQGAVSKLDENVCKQGCEASETCFGIQIHNDMSSSETTCLIVENTSLAGLVPCAQDTKAFLKTKKNPYKVLTNTCLQNRICFSNGRDECGGRILDKEDYECMALCNAHPFCRYFLYGDSASSTNPQLRECILFEAQARKVDDCTNTSDDPFFTSNYTQKVAYVNGRTFIDQITWFGEPNENFATINGISYQECASLCDRISYCNAFIHTWNYRRAPLGIGRPLLFTKTRIMSLDFTATDNQAQYLFFDLENFRLVSGIATSDDDISKQLLSSELTGGGKFKLKFWSSSGKCLSGNIIDTVNDSTKVSLHHTIETIQNNTGATPFCQRFEISDCSNSDVLEFEDFSDGAFGEPLRLQYSWKGIDGSLNDAMEGCVHVHRSFEKDVKTTGSNGSIKIEELVTCTLDTDVTITTEKRTLPTGNPTQSPSSKPSSQDSETPSAQPSDSWIPSEMPSLSMMPSVDPSLYPSINPSYSAYPSKAPESSCIDNPEEIDTSFYNAKVTKEICTKIQETCQEIEPNVLECEIRKTVEVTTCKYAQKTVKDLLQELYDEFTGKCSYQTSSVPQGGSYDITADIFGISFSGKGCNFDEDAASFSSQDFTFASDAVLLQNKVKHGCLSSSLEIVPCNTVSGTFWVYLFSLGHLFYADGNNSMKCITRQNNQLMIKECDRYDQNQQWVYNGNEGSLSIQENFENGCMIVSVDGFASVGSCTDSTSSWSRFEECRLNSRESTSAMELESIDNRDKCAALDNFGNAILKSCDEQDIEKWKYYYGSGKTQSDQPRLALVGEETQCLGRHSINGDYTSDSVEPVNLPTGKVPCDKYVFSRMELAGKENNEFRWPIINVQTNAKTFYCVDVPQPKQSLCSEISEPSQWRKFGDGGDATEISVKPTAVLQDITDPEVLFQFYLFSAEGKASRVLRSRMASLIRAVERTLVFLNAVNLIIDEALQLVDQVQSPLDDLNGRLDEGSSKLTSYSNIVRPFEFIPYVGPIIKGSRIRIVTSQVSKQMKRGTRTIDKTNDQLEKVMKPIFSLQIAIDNLISGLSGVYAVEKTVDIITRSSFCAYRENNMEYYEVSQNLIKVFSSRIIFSSKMLSDLRPSLSILDSFKADIGQFLSKPIKEFNNVLNPVFSVIDSLQFLDTIYTFAIRIPLPKYSPKRICIKIPFVGRKCLSAPWFSFRKQSFSLMDIGRVLKSVEDLLKKIPGVGYLMGQVEEAIAKIVRGIFKKIGLVLPSFDLQFDFISTLTKSIEQAINEMQALMISFGGITDIGDQFGGIFEQTRTLIYDSATNIDMAVLDSVDWNITFDDNGFPSFNIEDISFSIPDELNMIYQALLEDIQSIAEDIHDLLTTDMYCDQYETLQLNIPEYINKIFSIKIPLPSCPLTIRICTNLSLGSFDAFKKKMMERIESILPGAVSRNLLLGEYEYSGGLAINIPTKLIFDSYSTYAMKVLFQDLPLQNFKYADYFEVKFSWPEFVSLHIGYSDKGFAFRIFFDSFFNVIVKSYPKGYEPTEASLENLNYFISNKNDAMVSFHRDTTIIEILQDILCHLDFILTTKILLEKSISEFGSEFGAALLHTQIEERWSFYLSTYSRDKNFAEMSNLDMQSLSSRSDDSSVECTISPTICAALVDDDEIPNPYSTMGQLKDELGNDIVQWRALERKLSSDQRASRDTREMLIRSVQAYSSKIWNPDFPKDPFLMRDEKCRNIYNYNIGPLDINWSKVQTKLIRGIYFAFSNFNRLMGSIVEASTYNSTIGTDINRFEKKDAIFYSKDAYYIRFYRFLTKKTKYPFKMALNYITLKSFEIIGCGISPTPPVLFNGASFLYAIPRFPLKYIILFLLAQRGPEDPVVDLAHDSLLDLILHDGMQGIVQTYATKYKQEFKISFLSLTINVIQKESSCGLEKICPGTNGEHEVCIYPLSVGRYDLG